LLAAVAIVAVCVPSARAAVAQTDVTRALKQFDDIRALAMRGLLRAQELRTAHLYARGFHVSFPKFISEDMVIEGLWLFDYLNSMDTMAMSMIAYAAGDKHPTLEAELELFEAYLPEAARRTLDYHDRASAALAEAVKRANAAAFKKNPLDLVELPPQPWTDNASIEAMGADGFKVGWTWPAIQEASSTLGRHLARHGHSQERIFELAVEAGIDFIRPEDRNLFDWMDVEVEEGKYKWSRIDALLARCKKYDIALWLQLPSYNTSPPKWLRDRLQNKAVLTGPDGGPLSVPSRGWDKPLGVNDIRKENNPLNLFDPEVAEPFARYIRALITRIRQGGVEIFAVQLGSVDPLPVYGGPEALPRWRVWLMKNKIDPRVRWNMPLNVEEAGLPDQIKTAGVTDPGRKRLLLDIVRWREDECVEYFRVQVDAIHAVAPEIPICTQSCDLGELNQSVNGRPDERLIRELGLVSFGYAHGANIWDDLRRSYSPTFRSATITDTGTGNSPAQFAFSAYIHGALTIMSRPTPMVRGFDAVYSYYYPDVRWQWSPLGSWRRFHERAQGMGPEMANTRQAPQVALMWSDTTNKYQSFISDHVPFLPNGFQPGPANYHKLECLGWGRILDAVWVAHDVITEHQVLQGQLGRYEMLVMPAVQALPADVAQRIREYVENGGKVIATSAPALYDDDVQQVGTGQLADIFGADFDRFLPKSDIVRTALRGPSINGHTFQRRDAAWPAQRAQSNAMRTLYCAFNMREDVEVLEKFTTGETAAVRNELGKGKTLVIGFPMGREAFVTDPWTLRNGTTSPRSHLGNSFIQGLFEWLEPELMTLGLVRNAMTGQERVARGPTNWSWTRKSADFRDYSWDLFGTPRSVEVALRRREGNRNTYLTVFNREGGVGGADPGVIHYESTSKNVSIKLRCGDVQRIYDLSLGCAVPFTKSRVLFEESPVVTFNTMIEPAMARMFVIAINDETIRVYSGDRERGRGDETIRQAVGVLTTDASPPEHVVLGFEEIDRFLTGRAGYGITISAESPLYVPAAKRLASVLRKAYDTKVRVTRTSPRMSGPHDVYIERPDILLGSHNESHHIAVKKVFYQRGADFHTARLPVFASHTFPGPGRSITALMRPYKRRVLEGTNELKDVEFDQLGSQHVVIGASSAHGLSGGIENLIRMIGEDNE